ncbi:cadherin-like beta sandwich domain-containing protein [uncultured Clostridium sp.]|uniref:cadherin-like beta sandwich domain-containing protein n=1 Tax=uncultured Clostridium sp. TaxID=59620 RepID=UPI0028E973ED|nr:cadherin-like beta sandwich domain-containing protein [uncultured Clostridium sp.]
MGEKINKKRIISLFVALTCIFSLLPTSFGINEVQAATTNTGGRATLDITGPQYALTVSGTKLEGNTIDTGVKVDSTKTTYNTQGRFKDFQIDLPKYKQEVTDKKSDKDELQGKITEVETTTKIDRTIDIASINKIKKDLLNEIDVTLTQTQNKSTSNEVTNGITIENLPLGTNEVMYEISEKTTTDIKTTVYKINSDGSISKDSEDNSQTIDSITSKSTQIIIEHAENYAQGKIKKIDFKSYVGSKDTYLQDLENGNKNKNKVPFLYNKELLTTDTESFFTYEHIVNDQIQNLDYIINFDESFKLDGAEVWMDGTSSTASTSGNTLEGALEKTDSKIMVIKMPNNGTLGKNYAIKLKFIDENSSNDYTLRKVDIQSKYNNEEILLQERNYIDKEFKDVSVSGEPKRYEGKIYLDKNAGKVNITPSIGKSSGYTVKLSNHYLDEYGKVKIKQQDFDKFVSFSDSTSDKPNANVIYMDVYEGSESSEQLGALLATYELQVVFNGKQQPYKFNFGDNVTLKEANGGDKEISFNSSIHKYDLYVKDPSQKIRITYEDGLVETVARVKVNGIEESIQIKGSLEFDLSNSGGKQLTITIYKDGTLASDKYVFNIQGDSDDGDGEIPSAQNAYLSYLNFNTGDLKKEDGNAGFSRETLNYDLVVKPDTKVVDVTAIVDEPKASITEAKVVETGENYNLTSGTKSKIPLQENGATTLQIVVTAENGKDKKMYTVVIKHDGRSNNADLKDIELNTGDYEFNSKHDTFKARVDQDVKSVKVKPIPVDENYSSITVDGEKFTGSPISISLKGQWKTEVDIVVVAEDGSTKKTYELTIYRTNDPLDDIKDPDDDDDDDDDDDKNDAYYDESNKIWIDMSKYEEWGKVNGKYIYFDKRGRQVKDAWVKVDGKWFYVNKSGYRATGWREESDGRWYYLDNNGRMITGWFYDKERGNQYYFNQNGSMQVGWLYLGGNWYYFESGGRMLQNEKAYIDDAWYSFSNFGIMY